VKLVREILLVSSLIVEPKLFSSNLSKKLLQCSLHFLRNQEFTYVNVGSELPLGFVDKSGEFCKLVRAQRGGKEWRSEASIAMREV
jgi:hypothetical protein